MPNFTLFCAIFDFTIFYPAIDKAKEVCYSDSTKLHTFRHAYKKPPRQAERRIGGAITI